MSNIFSKLRDFVGFNEPEYEYEYDEMDGDEYQALYQQEHAPMPPEEDPRPRRAPRIRDRAEMGGVMGNVIGMPGATNGLSEVMVLEPRSFEEMPLAIQALRERKSVVLNLTLMDPDQAQRAVDFVAGGTYAIDGHQERIGESIFLFTPSCVQVSTQNVPGQEAPMPQPQQAPQGQMRMPRQAAPAPTWATEMRMAQ